MTNFTFTDRTSWLAWRAEWRQAYKAQTESIRSSKRTLAALHAERRTVTGDQERGRIDDRASSAQGTLAYERRDASRMMAERIEANKQKAALIAARQQIAA